MTNIELYSYGIILSLLNTKYFVENNYRLQHLLKWDID